MAPPVKKKKKHSSANHRPNSATDTNQQKPLGSFVTFGKRRSVRVAMKMNSRRWICNDIWMDILPLFRRPQLGLKMALLSPRFNSLVDAHFDGKAELTICRLISIEKRGTKAKPSAVMKRKPMPDRPLPNKIRFTNLWIEYIDHSVITFLRYNKQIFDKGINLRLDVHFLYKNAKDAQPIWDVFARKIWPIVVPNIRHLAFSEADHLDNMRRRISPTILTDLDQLDSIDYEYLLPDAIISDDGPNATAGQALAKWLNTPTTNGQPKQFHCDFMSATIKWVNAFKEAFLHATTSSANYIIRLVLIDEETPIESFELVNGRTNEKLTMEKEENVEEYTDFDWLLKRCQIGKTIQWENKKTDNLNNVDFTLHEFGPLSPPKAGQMNAKGPLLKMNAGPSGQRKKK